MWFDQSELRGGDAWDSQIKKQIHDCALFVPLISAHTNARIEGYFRGEWNLATRRLVNRAQDAAFLMPVVIDETREADARVPEEFLQRSGPGCRAARRRRRLQRGCASCWAWIPAVHAAKAAVTGAIEPSASRSVPVSGRRWPRQRRVTSRRTRPRCTAAGTRRWSLLVLPGRDDAPAAKPVPADGAVRGGCCGKREVDRGTTLR